MTQPDLHVFHRVVYKMKRTYSGGRFTVYYVKITLLCNNTDSKPYYWFFTVYFLSPLVSREEFIVKLSVTWSTINIVY